MDTLKTLIPEYAKDIKLNLGSVLQPEHLNQTQVMNIALACAYASRNNQVLKAVHNEAEKHLDETHMNASKTAASLMGMNNIYYRFIHLVSDDEYGKMPARLRMNGIMKHGISTADFELASLAVSAINGCGMCMDSHVAQVLKHGITKAAIQDSIRIASTIKATADVLNAEDALAA